MNIEGFRDQYGVTISTTELQNLHRQLGDILLGLDRTEAIRLADTFAASYPLAFIYIELIQPVLYTLGEDWANGHLSTMRVQIASAMVNSILASLYAKRISGITPTMPSVLVCGVPGNQHELGARVVADLLDGAGFHAVFLDPPTERVSLIDFALTQKPAAVALSATLAEHITELWEIADSLRRGGYSGLICAGGYALQNHNGHLWHAYGVDWANSDVLSFLLWLADQLTKAERKLH